MTDPGLLVLSRSDIARLMTYEDYVTAVESAFIAAENGRAVTPPAAALHVPDGSFHAKGAALLGEGAVTAIKINGNFPGNPAANGLPTVQGVIYLADGANGRPLAVMDSIEVTINRTAAATTLAARHLARQDCRVATVCGAGVQGRIQLIAIAAVARLERVNMWDADVEAAERLAREMSSALKLDVRATADLSVTRESDIIVTLHLGPQCLSDARPRAAGDVHLCSWRRQLRQAGNLACSLCGKCRGRGFARPGR
jgi:alanine dehydrogenase